MGSKLLLGLLRCNSSMMCRDKGEAPVKRYIGKTALTAIALEQARRDCGEVIALVLAIGNEDDTRWLVAGIEVDPAAMPEALEAVNVAVGELSLAWVMVADGDTRSGRFVQEDNFNSSAMLVGVGVVAQPPLAPNLIRLKSNLRDIVFPSLPWRWQIKVRAQSCGDRLLRRWRQH